MSDEDMQAAFRAFMNNPKSPPPPSSPSLPNARTPKNKSGTRPGLASPTAVAAAWKKAERRYWQILKAFQGTLQRSWLDTDNHLGDIVSSVANLRVRIGVAAAELRERQTEEIPEWDGCGYRSYRHGVFQRDDVEMTLSHNLRQHEKMMGGLRMVVSSLADAQEILGRRLEEIMLFHQETTTVLPLLQEDQVMRNKPDDNVPHTLDDWAVIVNRMERVYTMLAVELYRKQRMVQRVLDSSRDDLLSDPNDDDDNNGGGKEAVSGNDNDTNGLELAEECVAKWPRDSKASAVQPDILQQLLEL